MNQRTVVFLAAYDSQLKWCARLRDAFVARGFTCRVVVPPGRSALSDGQIADAGFEAVEAVTDLHEVARSCDVLVSALAGPATRKLTTELALTLNGRPGPVIVSGWVGVIIEKLTAGYLDRCGADVIAVNSVADREHFAFVARQLDLPDDNLLLAGLPLLSGTVADPRTSIRSVLFADQPTVPNGEAERSYLYGRLIDYARRHPDRQVRLKPRHRPEESTFHRMRHHPERLLAGVDQPPNFGIDYTPISEALPTTDLLLTVSSTASLEAIEHGCRVGLVLDLGVHERFGNHVFLDSGLLRTFGQLGRDEIGTPEPAWWSSYFFERTASPAELIVERVDQLLVSGERPSHRVWRSEYFGATAAYQHALAERGPLTRLHPFGWRALRRRVDRHGPIGGTARHAVEALLPPVLKRPLVAAARPLSRPPC